MSFYRPFSRLLIANRGEIARRIMRTAKTRGLHCIAVYSEADKDALFVREADSAVCIGPASAKDSYLNIDAILQAAHDTQAEAIHPGYGFLSENAQFAEAVTNAGLVFVGPPAAAIRALGNKAEAKNLMRQAGGDLLSGTVGCLSSLDDLHAVATQIGFPLILKPVAGGGGKGMKVVHEESALADAFASGQREAEAAFGDARMLAERFLQNPRHVEVQIFADSQGNSVHLFERDCTLQRRQQKVIEEAPAPHLADHLRSKLHASAVGLAQMAGYVGAGTVEFLVEGDKAFFMEMNTRLQVEHPVTEAITGQDLVDWQLRVAMGEKLPLAQDQIKACGHAVEARLYAEDPARNFLPQIGRLEHLAYPDGMRVESAVQSGDEISIHYDPMIAKLITFGVTRDEAMDKLSDGLARTEIAGLVTNRQFLIQLLKDDAVRAHNINITYIDRHLPSLLPDKLEPDDYAALAQTAAQVLLTQQPQLMAWRNNLPPIAILHLQDELGHVHHFSFTEAPAPLKIRHYISAASVYLFLADGRSIQFKRINLRSRQTQSKTTDAQLTAPMPGRVVATPAQVGQIVPVGTALVVLEAMKMEHTIKAPVAGKVVAYRVQAGDQVADGAELFAWEPEDEQ